MAGKAYSPVMDLLIKVTCYLYLFYHYKCIYLLRCSLSWLIKPRCFNINADMTDHFKLGLIRQLCLAVLWLALMSFHYLLQVARLQYMHTQ